MAHRHYGLPAAKPHPTYAVNRAAAWSGGAIVGGIIAVVIVLVFISRPRQRHRRPAKEHEHSSQKNDDGPSMSVRGTYSGGSTSRRRPTYARAGLRAAWSPPGLVAAILAVLVVTVAIVLAISR
jgi:hypothetical protein